MGEDERRATAKISLRIGDRELDVEIDVPPGPTRTAALVPFAHAVAEVAADVATEGSRAEGRPISCRKGCGACCRQLVPVAESEARRIADLVAAMPEPRQAEVRARFAGVERRLAEAGFLERMRAAASLATPAERRAIGDAYFALQIACPFLVDESCSIHPDRPAACREYLVTNPAANCAHPSPETIRRVEVSTKVSRALFGLDAGRGPARISWLPLSIALAWAEEHPEPPPERTGEEILRDFLGRLGRRDPAESGPSAVPDEDPPIRR
jgi:Fe-S-cluster containining protein